MRLWTLHPRYLDPQGLVALWREALLAQHVLQGRTRGYRHHPQLQRFHAAADPCAAIACFLRDVHSEATARGYRFDAGKIPPAGAHPRIPTSRGQLEYEARHLHDKLLKRRPALAGALDMTEPAVHPLFEIVPGPVEDWERP